MHIPPWLWFSTIATTAATVATAAFGVALRLALGPVGLIVSTIGLLVAGGIALWKNWDEGREAIQRLWTTVKPIVDLVVDAIQERLGPAIKIVSGLLTGDFSKAWTGIKELVFAQARSIIQIWNNTLGRLPGIAQVDLAKVEAAFLGVAEAAYDTGHAMQSTGEAAVEATAAVSDVGEAATDATPPITATGDAAADAAGEVETYADRLQKAREELEQAREEAAEAVLIQTDLALSYGDMARYAGEAALSVAELEAKLDAEAKAADKAAQATARAADAARKLRAEIRKSNEEFRVKQNEQQGLTEADLIVAQSEFNQLRGRQLADLLAEAEELGVDPVRVIAQQRNIEQAQADEEAVVADEKVSATTELSDTIAAQTEELGRSKLEQALMGDSSKELELAQLRLAWAVEDNEDATADYNSALNHSQMLMSDSKTSAEQLATANDALTSSYRRVVEAQNAFRTAQANVRRAGGGGSGSGVSGGGGGGSGSSVRDGIATFVETTTDAAGWTLSRTTTDDFDGNRRTTVTGTRSDGSTFQTDDETFESAEQSNRGMALGGIVRSRPGGMRVTVAEGGQDEAIVPLSEFPRLLTESLRFERAGFGAVQPTPISIENRISLTLGRQQFEDLMLETRESLRLQRRW